MTNSYNDYRQFLLDECPWLPSGLSCGVSGVDGVVDDDGVDDDEGWAVAAALCSVLMLWLCL